MVHTIVFANAKGGCAKTTSAINVAAALARSGRRTLLIDFDLQANATRALFPADEQITGTSKDLFYDARFEDVTYQSVTPGLDIIPATIFLVALDAEKANDPHKMELLLQAVNRSNSFDDYEYIIIDTPPAIGLVPLNVLTIATDLIVPISDAYSIDGITFEAVFLQKINSLQRNNLRLKQRMPRILVDLDLRNIMLMNPP